MCCKADQCQPRLFLFVMKSSFLLVAYGVDWICLPIKEVLSFIHFPRNKTRNFKSPFVDKLSKQDLPALDSIAIPSNA